MKENKHYKELQVQEGTYIPDMNLDYPQEYPFERMYHPTYTHKVKVDKNYPFVDDSLELKLKRWFVYEIVLNIIENFRLHLQFGLRFEGREILKKYKQQFKRGAITLANHCFRKDAEFVLLAIKAKRTTKIPMFAPNFGTKDEFWLRTIGGIPIPPQEEGMSAYKCFNAAFDEFHKRGSWFHIFPEAARWDWYKPLRPFQKGAFTWAYKYNIPIIPCVITFRERTGIYKLLGDKSLPLVTVKITEPIFPDTTQPRQNEVDRMREEAHKQMEKAAGITHNPWPIVWENE